MNTRLLALSLALGAGLNAAAPTYIIHAESGFLAVLDNDIQFGKQGDYFSYVRDGGHDVLVSVQRYEIERRQGRHSVSLLYQPLDLVGEKVLKADLHTDGTVFPAGTPMRFRYAFPFYRASWIYDLIKDPRRELSLGLSMQVRNATIEFTSLDGSRQFRASNIGPVPILKARGRMDVGENFFIGFEADGFYAPISYLNGSDEEITGAILDASLRAGQHVRPDLELFLNLRYLGGGSVGTNKDQPAPRDGYTRNWLHFATGTVGMSWTL